jgi:ATP-dependent DNA helicase RecQ
MLSVIRGHPDESGIVYCATRRSVDSLTDWLERQGVSVRPYHAGLNDRTRQSNQEAFARDQVNVVVATVAFGMGIDKSNVRFVIHRDMPRSIEAWYQEIGRAGRDGLASDCITFYSWADVASYETFLGEISDPELRKETRAKTVNVFRLLDRGGCRHQALVGYFDEMIAPCGDACDACLGLNLDDVSPTRSVRRKSTRQWVPSWQVSASQPETVVFERLRALRRQLADRENVPAYIIFNDAVLREMALRRPTSDADLLAIPGVGPAKLARYGPAFLEVLIRSR